MSENKESYVRISNAFLTEQEWKTINPILLSGEIGFESGTGRFKVGDGNTEWNKLSYYIDNYLPIRFDKDGLLLKIVDIKESNLDTAAPIFSIAKREGEDDYECAIISLKENNENDFLSRRSWVQKNFYSKYEVEEIIQLAIDERLSNLDSLVAEKVATILADMGEKENDFMVYNGEEWIAKPVIVEGEYPQGE